MGLWGGVPDILQSTHCNLPGISDILQTVPDLLKNGVLGDVTEGTVNLLEKPIKAIGDIVNIGNQNTLLGGVSETLGSKQDNKKPPRPLLGILG